MAGGGLCFQLDPLPSEGRTGRSLHRHCLLPAGHSGLHRSVDADGDPVHDWRWLEEDGPPPVVTTDPFEMGRLF